MNFESVRDCPKCNHSFYVTKGDFKGEIAHAECEYKKGKSYENKDGEPKELTEKMRRFCSFCGYVWFEDIYRPEQEELPMEGA